MSRSRDNRRRKARARRRLREWEDRPSQFTWIVIDDPHKGPINDPAKVRSFAEYVLGFGPITMPPHVVTMGVDLAKRGDRSVAVVARHGMSGRVRIEEVIADLDSPETTPDHD